jgi:glycosyltransferase involved in cell wall biosynthesis
MSRVLHVLPDLARGGGQMVVLQLVAHADRRRFEPIVVALTRPDDLVTDFVDAGARPTVLAARPPSTLVAAARVARLVRRRAVDVVHVHSGPDRKVGQLAALATGVPVVGHLHAPWPHLAPMCGDDVGSLTRGWSHSKAALRRRVERRTCARYIAVGDEVACFHRGLVDGGIVTVPNGVDLRRFTVPTASARRSARADLGLGADSRVIVSVGRLVDGKGHADLVRALSWLPGVHLVLVGDGARRAAIEHHASALGVGDRLLMVGHQPDVRPLLGLADAFVLASSTEGLPMSVLEAMATGLPVVAYDIDALRSIVTEGATGHLVPHGDEQALASSLERLLDEPERRASMAVAARSEVEHRYDARLMTRSVESVYEAVLQPTRDARRGNGRRLRAA